VIVWVIGYWKFSIPWDLLFGAWNFSNQIGFRGLSDAKHIFSAT
jgi:hypothetical protein